MRLDEIQSNISLKTHTFLNLWSHGETEALRILSPVIIGELQSLTVKDNTYKLYRGYKFEDEFWVKDKLGIDLDNIKEGNNIEINLVSPTSWSKSKQIAAQFTDPNYDSFAGKMYDEDEISDLDYEDGDILGIGILLAAEIPRQNIIADLTQINSSLINNKNEQEVIVIGKIRAKVINIKTHIFHSDNNYENEPEGLLTLSAADKERIRRAVINDLEKSYGKIK